MVSTQTTRVGRRTLAFWLVVVAAVVAPLTAAASLGASCADVSTTPNFEASFHLKGPALQLRVFSPTAAAVFDGARCVASCHIRSLAEMGLPASTPASSSRAIASGTLGAFGPIFPEAIDMDCSADHTKSLDSQASLVFRPGHSPVFRLGSWLRGYRDLALKVDLDRLSKN
jgi:hypothetical protein